MARPKVKTNPGRGVGDGMGMQELYWGGRAHPASAQGVLGVMRQNYQTCAVPCAKTFDL